MANSIEFAKNYTGILDEVYQRAEVSRCLNSGGRMVRAGRNAKEILIPKISVTGLGDYTRNVGYKTGNITYEYETHSFGYDRAIRLFADVMDVEESGVLDCFVEAGAELMRTQVAPEADVFTFAQIAGHTGVTTKAEDLSEAEATDVLQALREVTSAMDEKQVTLGSRCLFITPTLKGVLDDYSYANPGDFRMPIEESRKPGMSDPRNETMLKIFSFVNVGERAGSGLGTIEGGWTAAGYPAPSYDVVYGPDRTTLTLPLVPADSTGDRTRKAADRQLNANEQAAFNLAVETGGVTTRGAAEATGLSRQAASALLKRLAYRGLLTWHGKSPKDQRQYYTASTDKQGLQ